MQSNTNKTKKTRKRADKAPESASPMAEDLSAPRAKSAAPAGSSVDVPSPVKKHRRATKTVGQIPAASSLETVTGSVTGPVSDAEIAETQLQLAPSPSPYSVSHEEIAKRAYLYWVERGYTHGDHLQDWLRAENELTAR